jgi:hypothetical protein
MSEKQYQTGILINDILRHRTQHDTEKNYLMLHLIKQIKFSLIYFNSDTQPQFFCCLFLLYNMNCLVFNAFIDI